MDDDGHSCQVSGASGGSGLAYEACEVEGIGEDVAHIIGFGAVVEAVPGRALEVATGLVGVATLGVALAT